MRSATGHTGRSASARLRAVLENHGLSGRFVDVGDAKTFVVERGQGQPLVLIHGLDSSLFTWRLNIDMFARTFRVISLDLPGFGLSEKPLEAVPTFSGYAEFLERFFEKFGISRAGLVGHSFGGTLCLEFCRKNSQMVEKMILVSAPAREDMGISERKLENLLMFMYHDKSFITPELAKILKLTRANMSAKELVGFLSIESEVTQGGDDVKIATPCHIVWGRDDALFPPETARRTSKQFSCVKTSVLSKCGHAPHEERHDEFNELALRFLG